VTGIASGVRSVGLVRFWRAVGGVATHALLCRGLGLHGYGVLALAYSVLGLVKIFDLNTQEALQALVPLLRGEGEDGRARRLALLSFACNVGVALLGSAALVLFAGPIALFYAEPELAPALRAVALLNLVPVVRGPLDPDLLMGLRCYRPFVVYRALELVGSLLAALLTLVLHLSPAGSLLCLVVASLPSALFTLSLWPGTARTTLHGEADSWPVQRFLRFSLPLTLSQALYRVYAHAGTALVGGVLSVPAAGLHRFAVQIAELSAEFLGTVPQVLQPLLARARTQGKEAFSRLFREVFDATLQLAAPAAMLLIATAPWLVRLLGREEFQAASPLLEILALQVLFRTCSNPCYRALLAQEKSFPCSILSLIKVPLEMGAVVVLVQAVGLPGASWAHAFAAFLALLGLLALVRRFVPGGRFLDIAAMTRDCCSVIVFFFLVHWIESFFGNAFLVRAIVVLGTLLIVALRLTRGARGRTGERLLREEILAGVPLLGRKVAGGAASVSAAPVIPDGPAAERRGDASHV